MRLLYIVIFALLSTGAYAQNKEQTLADVRQDLTILYIEMLKLKRELSTTGVASPQVVTSGSSFVRLEAIESELQRLIAQTEDYWLYCSIYWLVWNGLGHNECIY